MPRLHHRRFAALLTVAACAAALQSTAALTAQGTAARGSTIGFEESYAFAPDRSKVVATLIPGTEDWYYYHCRERLDARDFATVRQVLPAWIQRHGRSPRVLEIENREALLSYGESPERTFDFLRQRLGLSFDHQRVVPGAKSDLPTHFDPTQLAPTALTQRALAEHPETVDGFTTRALAGLVSARLTPAQRRSLLQRLDRPDVAGLATLVVEDLRHPRSSGFGSLPIHGQLRLAQLEECAALEPSLLQQPAFVEAWLVRLQPGADTNWRLDPAERLQHLERLQAFVQRLAPAFNSLKAQVLYHRLQHDLQQGSPDRDRFLAYIRLPRREANAAEQHLRRHTRPAEFVDLGADFGTLLPRIGDDTTLVRRHLEHFFATDDSIAAFSDFLAADWLERVLAETRLMLGLGDQERWYAMLRDPAAVEEIERRVELDFAPTSRTRFGADDAVRLEVTTKNVPTLVLKVFAIDSHRYHIERQRDVDAAIELDGVVANHEETFRYDEPPMRRARRTFDLPMLRDPGTYVVEFVGNGISSRAVIQKGWLRAADRLTAAGTALTVFDERGEAVRDAVAWFGGREWAADKDGEILLPFSTDPGEKKVALRSGNRASLATFVHRPESYSLAGNAHVAREQLVAGQTAKLLVRPQLRLEGHPVSLALVQEPRLRIVATDLDGRSTTQDVRLPALQDDRDVVHELRVPERLRSLHVTLLGTVKDLAGKDVALDGGAREFTVNGIDKTTRTGAVLLQRSTAGYALELRGKNGEPRSGEACRVHLRHRDYTSEIAAALQSDADGRIHLGLLPGITSLRVSWGEHWSGFTLGRPSMALPPALHGRVGDVVRLPYQGNAQAATRAELSLLGHGHDAFEHLAVRDGFVEITGLPAGDYELHLHESRASIPVRITAGARDGRWLVGRERILEAVRQAPLQVSAIEVGADELVVRVKNATAMTRVHVTTTRYVEAFDPFRDLVGPGGEAPVAIAAEAPLSSYHAGRRLGDEYRYVLERRFATKYPGNMLPRPSLLLHAWTLDENSWNEAVGLGGGAGGRFGGRGGGRARRSQAGGAEGGSGLPGDGSLFANLDFLPHGAGAHCNLTVGEDGTVRLPLEGLGDGQQIHVIAIDGDQVVHDMAVRAETRLVPRNRTLAQALPADRHFAETRRIEFVDGGAEVAIGDLRSATVEVHDSLASVFRLFSTLDPSGDLLRFEFLLRWPTLNDAEKRTLYGEHACHELHFWLRHKDPAFFAAVVQPFLVQKLEPTFLDDWLCDRDLTRHLETWRFAQLNLIEKILLARRLGGEQQQAVARDLKEQLEVRPVPMDRLEDLFRYALDNERLSGLTSAWSRDARGFQSLMPAENAPPPPSGGAGPGAPSASGPATGGPAGPTTGAAPARKAEKDRQADAGDEAAGKPEGKAEDKEVALELLESARELGQEQLKRQSAQQLFRAVEPTRLLVEHNWFHRRPTESTAGVVAPNAFWLDYALAPLDRPFVSAAVAQASGSVLEMLMALAVLDLPAVADEHTWTTDGPTARLRAATPLLLVKKEVGATDVAADADPLLLGQNFYRLEDRYQFVDGQRRDRFVDEFVQGIGYGCQVVVSNPTSQSRNVEVLLQVPAGAIPLNSGFWTRGLPVVLGPYATTTVEYAFYFPAAGEFVHYPVHAAERGRVTAFAEARAMTVLAQPSRLDVTSWEHVSQQGTPAETLAFVDGANVHRLDLSRIAWRMKDRAFHDALLARLRARHVFEPTLWSYAILHRDEAGTREYLRHTVHQTLACGTWLDSPLLTIDPRERLHYAHLELDPLVHARAHQLGGRRVIGNQDLATQYTALLDLLGYRPQLDDDDWLAATYYFLLQDRVQDALQAFAKVDKQKIRAAVQHDYLAAYLCFHTGDVATARRLASAHRDHPVPHWQQRFRTVLQQLDEAEGKVAPPGDGMATQSPAAMAPALELTIADGKVLIAHKNLTACEVRYYELDVEFAFSAQPFAGPDGAAAAYVQPNLSEQRTLPADGSTLAFALPDRFANRNVLVEVRAQGLVRARQHLANALDVRFLESHGQVAVADRAAGTPLPKVYVKVFARLGDGRVRFHKDGYTDLRGRFDYASLSDDPNAGASNYSVLVLDEQRGAVIREIAPPAR
jgi:hypothetical protein